MYSSLVRHIQKFSGVSWDYHALSTHPSVTLSVLREFSDKNWNWNVLTCNPNWSWYWVREFPDKHWNWRIISDSKHFTWSWVREFPDKPWSWQILSNKVEGLNTIQEFPDKPWDWYTLTLGPHITIDDMLKTPNCPWTINELLFTKVDAEIMNFIRFYRSHYDSDAWCDHTSRTPWSLIKKNMDLPWIFFFVRFESSSEFSFAEDGQYLYTHRWNWVHLSETLDFKDVIQRCPELPWDYKAVSRNNTVSYRRDVLTHPELPWDYTSLRLEDEKRDWCASNVIKRYWKRCATDPSFKMCRKVVLTDLFDALDAKSKDHHGD